MKRVIPKRLAGLALAVALGLGMCFAFADGGVAVTNAWAKATVPGQSVAGAYLEMTTSDTPAALVQAQSPAAKATELHSMTMEGDVMRMRPVPRIEVPAGKVVKLAPGGLHIMLIDLKQPLKVGDRVPLKLTIESGGKTQILDVTAEVKEAPPGGHHHK